MVLQLIVQVIAGHIYKGGGNAEAVELLLGMVVHICQHILKTGSALKHMLTKTDVRHFMVLYSSDRLTGNEFTVHTGGIEPAALKLQVSIHRKQNAADIGPCQNAAVFIGVNMYHIILFGIVTLKGDPKIFQQTKTETVFCFGIVCDRQRGQLQHHHSQILVQFLRGKVHHMITLQFVDCEHSCNLRFFFHFNTVFP